MYLIRVGVYDVHMSHWRSSEREYRCSGDCEQMGCPGHKLVLDFCRSTDIWSVIVDGKPHAYFDEAMFHQMIEAFKEPQ